MPDVQEAPAVGVGARRRHRWARGVAVVAAVLAVADLCRWANRWYVSRQFQALGDGFYGPQLLEDAHAALVSALLWVLLAVVAAGLGWGLRVLRRRD